MARALVIGGTRNLGPDLVAALLARGDAVTVLNRGVTPHSLPAAVERLRADRSDAEALARALRGRSFDVVVDTTLYTGADAEAAARILRGRAGRYVMWSTGQVYLVRIGLRRPFREEDYDGPVMAEPPAQHSSDHRNWTYGAEKRAAEDALRRAGERGALSCVVLRMPMINSERDHHARIAGYVHRLLDGGPILAPDDELPLRHVYGKDVVTATLRALDPAVPEVTAINVSQDETLTLEEMLRLLADSCGRPLRVQRCPRASLDRLGLLPACSPFSDTWMSALANERSKELLGTRYTGVREYLPRVVEAALALPAERVIGYERRPEELALAATG